MTVVWIITTSQQIIRRRKDDKKNTKQMRGCQDFNPDLDQGSRK